MKTMKTCHRKASAQAPSRDHQEARHAQHREDLQRDAQQARGARGAAAAEVQRLADGLREALRAGAAPEKGAKSPPNASRHGPLHGRRTAVVRVALPAAEAGEALAVRAAVDGAEAHVRAVQEGVEAVRVAVIPKRKTP